MASSFASDVQKQSVSMEEGLKWIKTLSKETLMTALFHASKPSSEDTKLEIINYLSVDDGLKWLDSISLEKKIVCHAFLLDSFPQETQLSILKILVDRWMDSILEAGK